MSEDVKPTPRDPPRFRVSQVVEGYLSLVFVALFWIALGRLVLPDPWRLVVILIVWFFAWLFAISGVRRGRWGAQVAGWVSLGVLVWHIFLALTTRY